MALGHAPPPDLVLLAKDLVAAKGISAAAKQLGVSPSTLARFIANQGLRAGSLLVIKTGLLAPSATMEVA
jgi:hypothetical protein